MNRYFFILGRNQALSLAESAAFFACEQMVFNPLYLGREFLIWETETKIDLNLLNKRLGGVIKAGEILAERPKKPDLLSDLSEALGLNTILKFLPTGVEKLFLGFSIYFDENKSFTFLQRGLERHFLTLKKEIKETGQKLRLVTSRGQTLSSVVVKKN